jgi:hypothetical protein
MSEEEDWEHEYPEGSLGWRINRKLEAIEVHALKSGAVFALLFVTFFTPAAIEIATYPNSPFFTWQLSIGTYLALAQWNTTVYFVSLLMFAGAFFYISARLVWHGWKSVKDDQQS